MAKLLKISGITSKNGRNDAEWLDVNVVTVSDEAKPEKLKMQRKGCKPKMRCMESRSDSERNL